MRLAYFALLAALASQASAYAPVSERGLAASGPGPVLDVRAPHVEFARVAARDNDGKPAQTNMYAASDASGAEAAVIGVQSTPDGPKILAAGMSDERKGALEALLPGLGVSGAAGGVTALPGGDGDPARVLILTGVGKAVTPEALRRAAGVALRSAGGKAKVAVMLPAEDDESVQAVAEGASLGAYAFNRYKSAGAVPPVGEIVVVSPKSAAVDRAAVLARHVKASRDLSNTPGADLYPETMVDAVNAAVAGLSGVSVEVWDEGRLAAEGMGGIVAVGKGSTRPPRLIKVSYNPGNAKGHVAVVGKGITFDSGGISLKPSAGMWEMKGDMSGSATALHAVLAAAELGVPTRMTAWMCMAENMPDGGAARNGDVLKFYNGKTAEVWNTDAEGRLVMADGLSIASTENPDLLFDIATLTGAQVAALGSRTAGLMGDDKAVQALQAASAVTGEPFHFMPFQEEMFADMVSNTADLRNIGAVSSGGMQKGGIFLSHFAGDAGNWAHLDVAGPALNSGGPWGFTSAEGTGFGLRTLVKVAEQLGA